MAGRPVAHKVAVRDRKRSSVLMTAERGGDVPSVRASAPASPAYIAAPPKTRDDFVSASDYAYTTIRHEIVDGRFPPGRRMRETQLSEWLGISRTPLRHALSRLEVEGLLAVVPRVGLVVSSLDDQAVFELYETREALEGTAAALAARHASEADIATLQKLIELQVTVQDEPATLYQRNRAFHEAIYAAAHNRFLLKSLQALHDALALLGPTTLSAPGRPEVAQREHARIVTAIVNGDVAAAEAEARAHIRNGFPLRRAMRASRTE